MTEQLGTFEVAIEGKNKTDKAAKQAEKRLGEIPKRVSAANERSARLSERSFSRSTKSVVGSLGRIEQATARVLGTNSLTSGLAGRLGAVGEAGEAMGAGMMEAAGAGGILATAATGVAVAVGGTIAVLGAAAYAAINFGNSWAAGAAGIGRIADTIGVSTKALQEFTTAAERVGVDKGTATGTLASLSQTLNAAKNGRNTQALEMLRRMGVGMVLNKDGTVNVEAMEIPLANAITRQNSSGRRTAGQALGIPLEGLPIFTQGGKALAADLKDAGTGGGVMISDPEISQAKQRQHDSVRNKQWKDQKEDRLGHAAAEATRDSAYWISRSTKSFDEAVKGNFGPASSTLQDAAWSLSAAIGSVWHGGSGGTPLPGGVPGGVGISLPILADRIEHLGENSRQNQVSPKGAVGVMQVMPPTARATASAHGIPFDENRYRTDENYNRMIGRAHLSDLYGRYGGDGVLTAAAYNAGSGRVDKWIKQFGDPRQGQISDADFAQRIPYKETRDYVHRVVVELKNAPPGTRATVHSSNGAVSHAMQH